MRRLLKTVLLVAALAAPSAVQAQQSLGLGVVVGDPTGLSARVRGFQIHAGWSFSGEDAIWGAVDKLFSLGELDMFDAYWGLGASVRFADDFGLGARLPVGLNHFFQDQPIEVFGEVGPALVLLPDIDFEINGGIGVRYYF